MVKMVKAFQAIVRDGKALSETHLEAFNRDGYIILKGLLCPKEIERIKSCRDRAEARAGEEGGSFMEGVAHFDLEPLGGDESSGEFALRKVQEAYQVDEDFRHVTASDKILDVVEDLIGPDIYYFSSKLMCKPAQGGRRKPWHQDYAYWEGMNTKQVTVWSAIDHATTENGCMQLIPGSHRRGLIPHHQLEDYMIDEAGIENENILTAEMDAGDVLFFNVLTLHASGPNHSHAPRLSAIIDFDSKPKPRKELPFGSETPLRSTSA